MKAPAKTTSPGKAETRGKATAKSGTPAGSAVSEPPNAEAATSDDQSPRPSARKGGAEAGLLEALRSELRPTAKSPAPAKPAAPPPAPPAPAPALAEEQAPAPVASEVPPGPMRPMPPPKPLGNPGKDFKTGDHVVYPTHGVGQVQGIEEVPVAGTTLKVIVITFEENRMTLKVPMAKAASSGLRKLATPKVMAEAMETLKGRARIKRTMWSRRAQEYEQKINSGDPIAIAEVVRDLHRNAGQPDQSFSERQIYELALERLTAEVAARDGTDKTAAMQKLMDTLKTA